MKKAIIILIILIVSLAIITGCTTDDVSDNGETGDSYNKQQPGDSDIDYAEEELQPPALPED